MAEHWAGVLLQFAGLLDNNLSVPGASMFEELKNDFFQMLRVLEQHHKEAPQEDMCSVIRETMQNHTNAMRTYLRDSNSKKRQSTDNATLHIISEARSKSVRRMYHSKKCW